MNTFFLIIKKYFKMTDNILKNINSLQHLNTLHKIIYFLFIYNAEYSIQNKFIFFNNEMNNIFLTEEQKEEFISIFCKIQKTYFALSKFAYLYKYKTTKVVVDFDLCLNPIDINNKNSICLLQEKNKYYFRINDLINIIDTALSNSPMFFSEPLISKNPYNNIPFNKSTLYNIYFNITSKTFIVSELIHKFFLSNFDLDNFEKDYEYLIREYSIQKYIKYSDVNILYKSVLLMINTYNYNNYNNMICIHTSFPKKLLVDIMRPYLLLYYIYNYSLIQKKSYSKDLLFKKLNELYHFNPNFGRKFIKVQSYFLENKNKTYKNICTYNHNHICFYKESNTFLTSHLSDKNN
jgi:hypothetical protein